MKKKKKWIVIIVVVILSILMVLLALNAYQSQEGKEEKLLNEQAAKMGILPGMTDEEIEQRLNMEVAKSMLNISVNVNPIFDAQSMEGNLRLENIPGNNYAVTVELVLEQDGETVYKSGLVEPGYYVENVTLDKRLGAGEYQAVAKFTAYDPQTKTEIGTAGANIRISVR